MGMAKAAISLVVTSFLLSAPAGAGNVVDTVFGVTERTPYCSLDRQAGVYTVAFWLQDAGTSIRSAHRYDVLQIPYRNKWSLY